MHVQANEIFIQLCYYPRHLLFLDISDIIYEKSDHFLGEG
jgi:hypothetical protein